MTQRYLLFDSGCSVCTRLAEEIERASDGWLTARSLRNPEMQALLDTARPGWRWEPSLLEVRDGQPHAGRRCGRAEAFVCRVCYNHSIREIAERLYQKRSHDDCSKPRA